MGASPVFRPWISPRNWLPPSSVGAPPRRTRLLLDEPHYRDRRRRVYRPFRRLVVERHVSADDGDVEEPAGLGEPGHALLELVEGLGLVGVPEVEVVCHRERGRARADQVAQALDHRDHRAAARVQVAVPPVAVVADRDELLGRAQAQAHDAGVAPRQDDRAVLHHVVVLPVDPPLGGYRRMREEPREGRLRAREVEVGESRSLRGPAGRLLKVRGPPRLPLVDGGVVGEGRGGDVRHNDPVLPHEHTARVGHRAHVRGVQVPFREHALDLALAALLHDDEHALLGLREHDLVGVHPGLALGHAVELDLDAGAAAARRLARRARQPGRAHVLYPDDEPRDLHHLEACLDEELLHEWVPLLHGRPVR
jgi:hypothetical protein